MAVGLSLLAIFSPASASVAPLAVCVAAEKKPMSHDVEALTTGTVYSWAPPQVLACCCTIRWACRHSRPCCGQLSRQLFASGSYLLDILDGTVRSARDRTVARLARTIAC